MNKPSYIFIVVLILLGVIGVIGYVAWNKPFKDPLKGAAISISAIQLFNDFSANEAEAQKKYVPQKVDEKKVEVSGEIKEIGKHGDNEIFYVLKTEDEMFGVKCIMDKGEEIADAQIGDNIIVRGFCNGYNMDVIVNRCKSVK